MNGDDIQVKDIIIRQIEFDSSIDGSNIVVEIANGSVRLSGSVPSLAQKKAVSLLVWSISWVKAIDNQLETEFLSTSTPLTDDELAANVRTALQLNSYTSDLSPVIAVEKGIVTLTGVVDALWKTGKIESVVSEVTGVRDVTNLLSVVPTREISDVLIAESVMKSLCENKYIEEDKIVVTVANGNVRLQGEVLSARTAAEAYDAVSKILGVQSVNNEIVWG